MQMWCGFELNISVLLPLTFVNDLCHEQYIVSTAFFYDGCVTRAWSL